MEIRNKNYIQSWLLKFPFVQWDRMCINSPYEITVFGWIKRKDTHEDFVFLYFTKEEGLESFMTSSTEYSLEIYKILNKGNGKGHRKCQRVENHFNITNMIKLK